MSTTTKNLLTAAATVVFAIAATATTVTSAFAQSTTATSSATTAAATGTAAQNAVANSALVSAKAEKPAGLTRAQVQAEVIEARKNGTLLETEADFDVAQTKKHFVK
ncbi:DUF4148 domain-containing protein [Duganella sp. CT11-25]|jgi:hypothetical protein|uniref:DUF4148 domain-containing protein n=1 Tax=unclassified Duganella TaxID=2636909 RepID=UPI0039AF9445